MLLGDLTALGHVTLNIKQVDRVASIGQGRSALEHVAAVLWVEGDVGLLEKALLLELGKISKDLGLTQR